MPAYIIHQHYPSKSYTKNNIYRNEKVDHLSIYDDFRNNVYKNDPWRLEMQMN